jgi:hypothetical protein
MKHARIQAATPQQTALVAHLHSLDRQKIERTIEALVSILDLMDGDPDLEEDCEDIEHDGREEEHQW